MKIKELLELCSDDICNIAVYDKSTSTKKISTRSNRGVWLFFCVFLDNREDLWGC